MDPLAFNASTPEVPREYKRPPPFEPGVLSEFVTTNAGVAMPRMLYGISYEGDYTSEAVVHAVNSGFNGIDTGGRPEVSDESAVGVALSQLFSIGFERQDLFIQTKVNPQYAAELFPGFSIK